MSRVRRWLLCPECRCPLHVPDDAQMLFCVACQAYVTPLEPPPPVTAGWDAPGFGLDPDAVVD